MKFEELGVLEDAIRYQTHMLMQAKTDNQRAMHEYAKKQLVALAHQLCKGDEYSLRVVGVLRV